MQELFLDRKNSSTIGFVETCLLYGAIDKTELRAWAEHVIVTTDSHPTYIFELLSFDEGLAHIYRVIGFVPSSGLSELEKIALTGVTVMRGRRILGDDIIKEYPEQSLAALAQAPQVLARFRETFPFIDI